MPPAAKVFQQCRNRLSRLAPQRACQTFDVSRLMLAIVAVLCLGTGIGAGCAGLDRGPPIDSAAEFDAYPLYWVGSHFEEWDLEEISLRAEGFSTFIYGRCEPRGEDHPSCVPPLQIQIQPLCAHLEAAARAPIWRRRHVRGAPVGTIDSAPVLFTSGAQVKIYRGEGSDPGLPARALRALRSINNVEPVISETSPIPAPPAGVLTGSRTCNR